MYVRSTYIRTVCSENIVYFLLQSIEERNLNLLLNHLRKMVAVVDITIVMMRRSVNKME